MVPTSRVIYKHGTSYTLTYHRTGGYWFNVSAYKCNRVPVNHYWSIRRNNTITIDRALTLQTAHLRINHDAKQVLIESFT